MATKIVRVGDQVAIPVDRRLLAEIGLTEESWVEVDREGQHLVVAPARKMEGDDPTDPLLDRILHRYNEVFVRLAW